MALLLNKAVRAVTAPTRVLIEQKRFRGKINIQRPRKLFYERALVTEFVRPFFPREKEPVPVWEACHRVTKQVEKEEAHPYQRILAREAFERFNDSKMIAVLHKNPMSADEEFDLKVDCHHAGMALRYYGRGIAQLAFQGTKFNALLRLHCAPILFVLSPESNVPVLQKVLKKTPQVILIAGVLHDRLLNLNDFLKYGNMDITEARSQLVHTIQTAGGIHLNSQLNQHQTTFVSRLRQIGKNDETTNSEESKIE